MLLPDPKTWTIIIIPTFPATEKHIELYKSIRLSGLLLDPQAFGSTFNRESAFSPEVWRSRIDTKGRITLLATDREETKAIGTVSILCPPMLSGIPPDPPYPPHIAEKERQGQIEIYMLVGMWVHPDHRAKGVGRALVDRALDFFKPTPSPYPVQDSGIKPDINIDEPEASPIKIALLLVHNDQQVAIRLYQAAGFIKEGDLEHAGSPSTCMAYYDVSSS